ncbi:GntR family transcriptional regulator [Limnochorda pilosa]|uniref:GntR family transcriptional regulator n=1 Tax=Limnochorda pilosa TaxID=1555112 RepID=UPI00082B0E5E|nr:GntR family transcriptional regulator [Limnochorda pilosa]
MQSGSLHDRRQGLQPRAERSTKADEAYRILRRMIVTLELAPGTVIDERYFASQFGIGRTPLREAVQRLAEQNLVVSSRHRQSQVAPVELTDIQCICELRLVLEPMAASLACERADDEDIQSVRTILDEYKKHVDAHDLKGALDVDYEFHDRLARSTRNPHLADAIDRLNAHSQRLWFLSFRQLRSLDGILEEHDSVLQALAARRPAEAAQAMRNHIESFRERIRGLLL